MTVDAARHNNLQTRIDQILGIGSGDSGYGESVLSYQVSSLPTSNLNIISANDINLLYADLIKARTHQIGIETTEIAEMIADLNVIAENESFFVDDAGVSSTDPNGSAKGIVDFESLMTKIETDKFQMDSSNASLEIGTSSQRTTVWNGIIYHEFTVNFDNSDHKRHYFNSGGEIRFSASNSGAVSDKGKDWNELLTNIGVISFGYNYTETSGLGSPASSIGNYQLTSSYQLIYEKIGGGTFSGIYAGNVYRIYARTVSNNQIQFRVEFNDIISVGNIDDDVDGSLESNIQIYRAASQYVSVFPPSFTTNRSLTN